MSQTVIVTTQEALTDIIRGLLPQSQMILPPEVVELEKLKRKEYLTTDEVVKLYGLNANTLRTRRSNGEGPHYVKDGERVLYQNKAVSQYLEARRQKTHG